MTIFGKLLLIVNLVFSLLGLTWAVFVSVAPLESPDELKKYKDKADVARKSVREALNSRDRAAEALRVAETGINNPKELPASIPPGMVRERERDWYDAELYQMHVGDPIGTPPGKKSISLRALQIDAQAGIVRLDDKDKNAPVPRPLMGPLKDREQPEKTLEQPLEALAKSREDTLKAIIDPNQKIDTLLGVIQEHLKLTEQLVGSPEAKLKGLQQQLIEERIKAEKLLKQVEDLRPLYVNSAVESELILRRLAELRKRYNELQTEPAGAK